MQVFRLMDMPDRVIAFDELPEDLVQGFEMANADGFPRHWKQWMGQKERIIKIPPEKDFLTGQVRKFDPIVEKDSFFYLVDFTLGPVEEKWRKICDWVRQHVSKETRLMEKIDDMAVPLAANKSDGVTLEPEDVPIIHIPSEFKLEKGPGVPPETKQMFKCIEEGCLAEFDDKRAIRMHVLGKHKKEPVSVTVPS